MGIRLSVAGLMECQSKVPTETRTMTATSAAMGILETTGPSTMHRMSRKNPARKVDSRVRAPFLTLIIVWPIIAQPPIPPKKPVTMFAMPCPMDSRVLPERVSVISSTSFAVIKDSISPTRAIARAYGAMTVRVWRSNGTSGRPGTGSDEGSLPLSPTVGTAMPHGNRDDREDHDGDQRRRDHLRQLREEHHQEQARAGQRIDRPGHTGQVRYLGGEQQDAQRIDEADHHRARHEPHQLRHAQSAQGDLERTRQDHRRQEVRESVLPGDRGDDKGHRTGRCGDHRGAAADEGDHHGHRARGEEAHLGIDTGDDGEGDRLGDQRQPNHEAYQHLRTEDPRIQPGRPGTGGRTRSSDGAGQN